MLTLSSTADHLWLNRLRQEVQNSNVPDKQARVATYLVGLLADGHDQPTQKNLARLIGVSPTCVQDTFKRLRALGMLDWEHRYEGRRQVANRYWLVLPASAPVARPDVKRHRVSGVHRPSKQVSKPEAFERVPAGFLRSLAEIAAARMAKINAQWVELRLLR